MILKNIAKKIRSIFDNFFSIERDYFTIGGIKKDWNFFVKKSNIFSHLVDRIKFQYYPKLLISASFPTHLEVEAASKCQMRCPMCYTTYMKDHFKGIMKMDLYKKIIDEAAANNVYSIKLSWRGEPLLNPNLVEMIKYAKKKGIKDVAFLTNAELLTDKKSKELVESGLDWISISADGTDEIYNKIRFPAKFEETINKIKYLKKLRTDRKQVKPLIRVQSILTAVENDSSKFYKSWEGIADKINVIADHIRDYEMDKEKIEYNQFFLCPKPFQRITIGHDGRVHQCINDYDGRNILGDINKQSIKEVWDGEISKKLRDSFKKHTFLKENAPCNFCSYAFAQEKSSVVKIIDGLNLKIKRYKSAHKIVENKELKLKTPERLIPLNKIEEYKKITSDRKD